ncbi:hypothetical protein OSO01_07340 [Oceanobacillus sojae]|uniref:Uncharacterized protein n=1 Tax=Oceanobacillus sojae TaxID=582851 RepID=A0A511ZEW7_9BACI|nr:hypothetical protein OSO01_07340 [Oceanobacillus sojae]
MHNMELPQIIANKHSCCVNVCPILLTNISDKNEDINMADTVKGRNLIPVSSEDRYRLSWK